MQIKLVVVVVVVDACSVLRYPYPTEPAQPIQVRLDLDQGPVSTVLGIIIQYNTIQSNFNLCNLTVMNMRLDTIKNARLGLSVQ